MMTTQDDQVRSKIGIELGTLCKALWDGYIDFVDPSVYPN